MCCSAAWACFGAEPQRTRTRSGVQAWGQRRLSPRMDLRRDAKGPGDRAGKRRTRQPSDSFALKDVLGAPTSMGRVLPTAGVGYRGAQLGSQLSGGEIARPTVAGRLSADTWPARHVGVAASCCTVLSRCAAALSPDDSTGFSCKHGSHRCVRVEWIVCDLDVWRQPGRRAQTGRSFKDKPGRPDDQSGVWQFDLLDATCLRAPGA